MSKKGSTQNIERPQSAQELALLETQNDMQQQAIDVAKQQEGRSQEQYQTWKDSYLPMEVAMHGDPGGGQAQRDMLDRQMPRYAEDTSGVMNQPQQTQQRSGGKGNIHGNLSNTAKNITSGSSNGKGA